MTDSGSSLPKGSIESFLSFPWAEELTFIVIKMIQEVSAGFWQQKAPGELFSHLQTIISWLSIL
jgi:hypothetical protein